MTTSPVSVGLTLRLERVRESIGAACRRAGRDPASVTLIAVSKTHPVAAIREAMAAGVAEFGENRVQEALQKLDELAAFGRPPPVHLIGHLQTNKVRAAAGRFAILHGIDSARVLRAVSAAAPAPAPARIMIEVNVAGEATKFGVPPGDLAAMVDLARTLPNIALEGLMTVAPEVADAESIRPVFVTLRRLAEAHGLSALSMGMTNDFETAIEEGATHIRIGRAIFGERMA